MHDHIKLKLLHLTTTKFTVCFIKKSVRNYLRKIFMIELSIKPRNPRYYWPHTFSASFQPIFGRIRRKKNVKSFIVCAPVRFSKSCAFIIPPHIFDRVCIRKCEGQSILVFKLYTADFDVWERCLLEESNFQFFYTTSSLPTLKLTFFQLSNSK